MLVEQLVIYSRDHRNLERASPVANAKQVSKDLSIKQEQERREIEEWIAECTNQIDTFRVKFQGLIDDLHQSEATSKAVEDIIASAHVAIAKAQALIQDHELKLANEKKKMGELESTKHPVQKKLDDHSGKLEILQAQLASKNLLFNKELTAQALAEVEVARQKTIQRLRKQIQFLVEQEWLPVPFFVTFHLV